MERTFKTALVRGRIPKIVVVEQVILADCPAIKFFAALILEDHCLTDAPAEGLVSPAGHRRGAFAC